MQGVMEPQLANMSQRLGLELPLLYPLLYVLAVILGLAVAARGRAEPLASLRSFSGEPSG